MIQKTTHLAKKAVEEAGLYIAKPKDIDHLAEVAADAFENYPLHNWFTKGMYDKKTSQLIMQISLKTMIKNAVIYADSEEMNGFAIWLPNDFKGNKAIPFIFNGGLKLIFHSVLKAIGKMLNYEKYAMNLKKELTDNMGWYIYSLTVKKEAQGKRLASKLLYPMLKFCDNQNAIAYLETNKETNVALYEHFGFELKKEDVIPKSSVKHYAMVRQPQNVQ